MSKTTRRAASDNAKLTALAARLVECHTKLDATPSEEDEQLNRLMDRHWALRERINRIAATTLEGLQAKARAAEIALKEDTDVGNRGEGSFVDLCRSINQDILALKSEAPANV
jgi:hypothetical protein